MANLRRLGMKWRIAFIVLAIAFVTYRSSPELLVAFGKGSAGEAMPDFALPLLDGDTLTREDVRGKVVLVNFWASWCGPCRTEMPAFERVYRERKDAGFVILGVWTQDTDPFAMRELLREGSITYPVLIGGRAVERAFGGVYGLPTSFLIGRDGLIRQRVTGIFKEEALRVQVDSLLAERAP